jgi:hypothetical protein
MKYDVYHKVASGFHKVLFYQVPQEQNCQVDEQANQATQLQEGVLRKKGMF